MRNLFGNPRSRFDVGGKHRVSLMRALFGSVYVPKIGARSPRAGGKLGTRVRSGLTGPLAQHHTANTEHTYSRGRRFFK